jgi:hypothetical protein
VLAPVLVLVAAIVLVPMLVVGGVPWHAPCLRESVHLRQDQPDTEHLNEDEDEHGP